MAQQTIGLGAVANDGTGDDLRTAGDKINDNFTEVYQEKLGLSAWTNVASGGTTDLGAVLASAANITGTTTITSFGTAAAGVTRFVKFAGALTLTHNGTSLILPGGANIATAAGDMALAISEGSGNWRVMAYWPAAGTQPKDSDLTAIAALATAALGRSLLTAATTADISAITGVYPGHPGYIAGNWIAPVRGQVAAGAALAANTIVLVPFYLPAPITISDLGCRITTLAAGGNIQLAIYGDTAGIPTGAALAVTASITTAVATFVSADITGANVTLSPGRYWMAVNSDNATVVLQIIAGASTDAAYILGAPNLTNVTFAAAGSQFVRTIAQAYGTWPTISGGTTLTNSNSQGLVFMKAA